MFRRVLVANRGEIACRIIRTLDRLGIESVAVHSDADRYAPHVRMASQAVAIGASAAAESYLNAGRVLAAARESGAEAIHPGYGFLSENAEFAEASASAAIIFIGPTPQQMRLFGLKHTARAAAEAAGVPLAPGSSLVADAAAAQAEAARIGFPVMLKGTAGGGGIGLQRCHDAAELGAAFERTQRLAARNFGNAGVFLERWIARGRHIEVQIFGDGAGRVLALGERDCSVQRRHQKLLEETPPPGIRDSVLHDIRAAAVRLCESVHYANAGTVEFIYDVDTEAFYFLEVNTRLQVEHGITEAVTGIDLVEWMIGQASGNRRWAAKFAQAAPAQQGVAIEARLYAEDPAQGFRPSTGLLTEVRFPSNVRVESFVAAGTDVTPFYDPLLAKIIVHAKDRSTAIEALRVALAETRLAGIETNVAFLSRVAGSEPFMVGGMTTRALETGAFALNGIEVLEGGTLTTVQDLPGRLGYWAVGIPPSGPMDARAFAHANRAVGNSEGAAGLEMTVSGPTLRFRADCVICLSGAEMGAMLEGAGVAWNAPVLAKAGAVLAVGAAARTGCRAYLAVRGGFDVPLYLGSRSTFTLGKFGGHGGRPLAAGDVLHVEESTSFLKKRSKKLLSIGPSRTAGARARVQKLFGSFFQKRTFFLPETWQIAVLEGPHAAPDFFTEAGLAAFYNTSWEVHYNSSRTGVRLIGPKPEWARRDGGEAGLHPSNIHDTPYAVGAVDFTGDMPVILGPDGPSLGGFVCPCTIVQDELWKIGQLRPNDTVRFVKRKGAAVLHRIEAQGERPCVVYRRSGEARVLVEYGPPVLDLELRLRVHALMQAVEAATLDGILDITPGIRSLQVHFDTRRLSQQQVLNFLIAAESGLPAADDMIVPSRIVHLPLCWDDPSTRLAIAKYMQGVRADAPWCPSNIEFIRRINGLESVDEVKRIVFDATYLVLGLGDVYLGAPVATPLDPRHRLVTTKYNPARTWTPENAVGIGGAYLCIYGMEGPGGYQFIGRTCQMWNIYRHTPEFSAGKPWLLRFFDQLRFYEVTEAELDSFRADFPHGSVGLRIEDTVFSWRDMRAELAQHTSDIAAWKARQQSAFEAERARWAATAFASAEDVPEAAAEAPDEDRLAEGEFRIPSPVSGNVWRVHAAPGAQVSRGEILVVIESMKTELAIPAMADGVVTDVRADEGRPVRAGQTLFVMRRHDRTSGA
jgi:urea carboxylase